MAEKVPKQKLLWKKPISLRLGNIRHFDIHVREAFKIGKFEYNDKL